MTVLVEVSDAVVRLGGKPVLRGVTLSVAAGEVVVLAGPNGAGKSSLLRAIAGDLRPASGRVLLKGRDLAAYAPAELAMHRAVLSQHTFVPFPFSVEEIVRMGAGRNRPRRWVDEASRRVMAACDVEVFAHKEITALSGGEQQRVHLARTLLQLESAAESCQPGLLLLDEPTASLDLGHQLRVLQMARAQAATGTGVAVVIHDLNLAAMLATRVAMMRAGEIVADGPPSAVITDAIVHRVFGVSDAVGRTPLAGEPFVLPQTMRLTPPGGPSV
jgi:iron complex transport system ATP-binding protein